MVDENATCADSQLVNKGDFIASPNCEARRDGRVVDLLLLHYTATPTNDYALELLTSPEAGVSSHYLIDGEGRVLQLVKEAERAWHAGEAVWAGETDINSCSIGIEIQNQGAALPRLPDYGRRQMQAVIALCRDILSRHDIPPSRVLGHSDVAPHRKQDPGAHFNWRLLAENGIGLWVEAPEMAPGPAVVVEGEVLRSMQHCLQDIGYGLEISGKMDERTKLVVAAFQRRYRPRSIDGVIDAQTGHLIECLHRLIKA